MKKNVKMIITVVVIVIVLVIVWIAFRSSGVLFGPTTQCNDRYDNDGDRRCDYGLSGLRCKDGSIKGDSGCSSSSDNSEASCVSGSTICGVGACRRTSTCVNEQVSCTPGTPSTEICTDSIDNDCDGLVNEGCATNSTNSTG